MLLQQQLAALLGKSISQICPNGYTGQSQSAHFVAHVLGLRVGATCQMLSHGRVPGVTVRVHEIFGRCPSVGVWSLRPVTLNRCLVFVTRAPHVNLAAKTMAVVPHHAHVGLFIDGFVWHYSKRQRKVLKQTVGELAAHYPMVGNAMFYGTLP